MTFKNMKIAITDEVQLKAVCDVLQSMGLINMYKTNSKVSVIVIDKKTYSLLGLPFELIDDYRPVNLTDLLALRDKQFMEKIHAK